MSTITNIGGDRNPSDETILLKVSGLDASELYFRMKRHTKLGKLMQVYSEMQCVHPAARGYAFLYNAAIRLHADQTPYQLEMNDGDPIYAILHVPQFNSNVDLYALREKLKKQLQFVNRYISEIESLDRSYAEAQIPSTQGQI